MASPDLSRRNRAKFRGPARLSRLCLIAWILAVLMVSVVSLLPPSSLHRLHVDDVFRNDKLGHFAAYTLLAILPVAAAEFISVGVALAAGMIPLGVILEFGQKLIPGRGLEGGDMIANTLGVCLGVTVALCLRLLLRRRPNVAGVQEIK